MQLSKWVALGVAAFCLVAVGGVVNMPHLYFMAAMLLTLPAVSYGFGWFTLRGLEFRRTIPTLVWEGEELDIIYVVTNPSRIARFFVAIDKPRESMVESVRMDPPLFNVRAGESIEVKHRVRFLRRGVFSAGSFDVSALDPLGVFTFARTVSSDDEIVVYPAAREMKDLQLIGAERMGWNGSQSYARVGEGVDTAGVRDYYPGDALRRIHWRQTALRGQLTVIEFEEVQAVSLTIVIDSHEEGVAGTDPDTSLEYGIRLAATVARDTIQTGSSVEVVTAAMPRRGLQSWNGLVGERGDSRLYTLMDSLARVEPQREVSVSALTMSALSSTAAGATFLIVCIRPDPELSAAVAQCLTRGIAVSVVLIDPISFGGPEPLLRQPNPIVGELASLGAAVYVMNANPAHALYPVLID